MDSNHRPSGYEPDELPLLHAALGMAHGSSLPAVLPPVPSTLPRFTTRFGMERGGATALRARHWLRGQCRVWWMGVTINQLSSAALPAGKPSSMRSRRLHPSRGLQLGPLSQSSPGGLTRL